MKPCFGYIRVSTQKQGEGVSLEAQKDAITAFASRNHLSITQWFEEKETAAKRGRPVFTAMLKQLKQRRADGVVIHKIDRSARNLRDWAMFSELPDIGISVFVATESLDFNSRGGRLTADIQAVIATDYIRNLREECIKGIRGRLKQGLYPFRAPIGYLNNGRGKPKTPCPIKAPLIKLAYELYGSGQYSIVSLQREMERRGLTNHSDKPVTKRGIETILSNQFYTGLIHIARTGETYRGVHAPLITMRQYQDVQHRKAGRAGKKVTKHRHLYRGLFRCAACGRSMIPERQKAFVYYRCQTKACPKNIIREDRLDAAICTAYEVVRMPNQHAARLKQDWLAWLNSTERRKMLASLELRIVQTEERLEKLTDLLLDGAIDRAAYDKRKNAFTCELLNLREQLADLQKSDLSESQIKQFLELITSLTALHKILKPDEKRYLLENCFSNRTVEAEKPLFEPYSWLVSRDFSELTPMVNQLEPLLDLLERHSVN